MTTRKFCFAAGAAALLVLALAAQTTPPSHSATLAWAASVDASAANPVTYRVLRAPGACGTTGQTFAALAAGSAVTATGFVDSTVVGGQTYCYETEAVGANGAVSAPSNTATGAVPPFPASGLSVATQ